MLCLVIFLAVVCLGNVLAEDLEFLSNTDYVYTKYLLGQVESVTVDGIPVAKARPGAHCLPPNDCWEEVKQPNYLIVSGVLKGNLTCATVKVQPPEGRKPVMFVYKHAGVKCPNNSDARTVFVQNVADEKEKILHVVVFDQPTGEVSITGPVVTKERDWNKLTLLGKTGISQVDVVLFTGHVENTERKMVIKFTNGKKYDLVIKPSDHPHERSAVMTFIDYTNSFKLK